MVEDLRGYCAPESIAIVMIPGGKPSPDEGNSQPPGRNVLAASSPKDDMRDEEEIREQYEFLKEELGSEEMNHEGVRQMFTYYRRALGWVLEEEHM